MGRKKSIERGAEVRSSFHDNHLRRMYATYLINFPLREERVSRRYPRWPRIKIDRVFIRVFRKCKLIRDDAPFLFFFFSSFWNDRACICYWPRGRHLARWATGNIGRVIPIRWDRIWIRGREYSISGRARIYLTDNVTNDILQHRHRCLCRANYYHAINAINESRM